MTASGLSPVFWENKKPKQIAGRTTNERKTRGSIVCRTVTALLSRFIETGNRGKFVGFTGGNGRSYSHTKVGMNSRKGKASVSWKMKVL